LDSDPEVRGAVVEVLGKLRAHVGSDVRDEVRLLSRDRCRPVADAAKRALAELEA